MNDNTPEALLTHPPKSSVWTRAVFSRYAKINCGESRKACQESLRLVFEHGVSRTLGRFAYYIPASTAPLVPRELGSFLDRVRLQMVFKSRIFSRWNRCTDPLSCDRASLYDACTIPVYKRRVFPKRKILENYRFEAVRSWCSSRDVDERLLVARTVAVQLVCLLCGKPRVDPSVWGHRGYAQSHNAIGEKCDSVWCHASCLPGWQTCDIIAIVS